MTTYTEKQRRFIQRVDRTNRTLIEEFLGPPKKESGDSGIFQNVSTTLNAAQAGLLIAGVVSAPPTLGTGVAVTAGLLVLTEIARECYEWAKTFSEKTKESEYPDLIKLEMKRLALSVEMRQAAYLTAIRYRYVLEETLPEEGTVEAALATGQRFMKKMKLDLESTPNQLSHPEALTDFLLSSVRQSIFHSTPQVTLKQIHRRYGVFRTYKRPFKEVFARSEWVLYDKHENYQFIGSVNESPSPILRPHSTLREYGFVMLPLPKLDLTPLAVDIKPYREISDTELPNKEVLLKKLSRLHSVTRDEVEAYLAMVRASTQTPVQSLNDYLTERSATNVIACCHDDRLRDLNLQGGNFSDVYFYEANLEGCTLYDTTWTEAILVKAKFKRNEMNVNTDFGSAYAEFSDWDDVHIKGKLAYIKLSGATISNCTISPAELFQPGSEWFYVRFVNLKIENVRADLQQAFAEKLLVEHQARVELQSNIKQVEKAYEDLILQAADDNAWRQHSTQKARELEDKIAELTAQQAKLMGSVQFELKEMKERCDLLKKAVNDHAEAISQLQLFQNRQETLWRVQHQEDALRDERISLLEMEQKEQSVYSRICHYFEEELNTFQYQQTKRVFVEPLVAATWGSSPVDAPLLAADVIDAFMQSKKDILFFQGTTGACKTTLMTMLTEEWLHKGDLIPCPLDMSQVRDFGRNSIILGQRVIFSESQQDKLMDEARMLIMIDNPEQSSIPIGRLLDACGAYTSKCAHRPKYIFFVKPGYLPSPDKSVFASVQTKYQLQVDLIYDLLPLNQKQIERVVKAYHKEKEFKALNKDVCQMAKSPLMLTMILTILVARSQKLDKLKQERDSLHPRSGARFTQLSRDVEAFDNGAYLPTSRKACYEAYFEALYERAEPMLPEEYKDYARFKTEIKALAIKIYEQGSDRIKKPEKTDPLGYLFQAKRFYLFPLIITQDDARFIHPTQGFFLVAEQLKDYLLEENFPSAAAIQLWNKRHFSNTPELLYLLLEFTQDLPNQDLVLARLQTLIHLQNHSNAAANAFTLRCRINPDFIGANLVDISIPLADASEAILVGANITGNLANVSFDKAMLLGAKIQGDLTDARFIKALSFIQTDGPLKTFDVFPSAERTLIAYVVEPENRYSKYQIAIIEVTEEGVNKLKLWDAHDSRISGLTFTVREGAAYLVSVSDNGTRRIWAFDVNGAVIQKAQLNGLIHKSPINAVTCSPDGRFVATGSDDRFIRIWDIQAAVKVFKSEPCTGPVSALTWRGNQLIAAADDRMIYLWQTPEHPITRSLETLVSDHLTSDHLPRQIHSLALSQTETQLALGCTNGDILILNLKDREKPVIVLPGHKKRVNSLAFAENAIVSASDDHTVRIWRSKYDVRILQHGHRVEQVIVSPNGRQLISGVDSQSPRIYFWSLAEPYVERSNLNEWGTITCLAAQPKQDDLSVANSVRQDRYLAVGFINGAVMLYLLDLPEQHAAPLLAWAHRNASVQQLAWSSTGRFLASLGQDRVIITKDMTDPDKPMGIIYAQPNHWFNRMVFLSHPEHEACLSVAISDGSITVYDISQGIDDEALEKIAELKAWRFIRPMDATTVSSMVSAPAKFSTKTSFIAAATSDQKIELWSLLTPPQDQVKTAECFYQFDHPNGPAITLAWSGQGDYLASIDRERTVYVWSTITYHCIYTYTHSADPLCLFWSDKWLMLGTSTNILIWDISTVSDTTFCDNSPRQISVASALLCDDSPNIIVEDDAIFQLNRDLLVQGHSPVQAWVKRIKPGLYVHGCDFQGVTWSSTNVSSDASTKGTSTKEFLAQKGGVTDTLKKRYRFFTALGQSSSKQSATPFPKPMSQSELLSLQGAFGTSKSSLFEESSDHAHSSYSSPRGLEI